MTKAEIMNLVRNLPVDKKRIFYAYVGKRTKNNMLEALRLAQNYVKPTKKELETMRDLGWMK